MWDSVFKSLREEEPNEYDDICTEIQAKLDKSIQDSPVAKDLVRLYKKITITRNSTPYTFMDFVSFLSFFQEKEILELNFDLQDFKTLSIYMDEHIPSNYLYIFKVINQEIPFIIIKRLKAYLTKHKLFCKDVNGSWTIDIIIQSNHWKVIHHRRECIFEKNSGEIQNEYEMEWNLKIDDKGVMEFECTSPKDDKVVNKFFNKIVCK
jgi:hypothetical protein